MCLKANLALGSSQSLLIRGATSALGQAAINIAVHHGARVFVAVRNDSKIDLLNSLGVEAFFREDPNLSESIRERFPRGIDAVLDLVGNSTILDSLKMVRRNGRACLAGFLGGGDPIADFQPLMHMPTGVHLSFFASALVFGSFDYPLSEIPFDTILKRVADGVYKANPARVFAFEEIQQAHRMMDANSASGKIVVKLSDA
jgi:NADPH:quinone reductase-like Zn-dependent oxidoreductase